MILQTCLTVLFCFVLFWIDKSLGTLECNQINTTCNDTAERFTFLHECPKGSKIYVSTNKTVLADGIVLGISTLSRDVINISNNSVVTRNCRDLLIKCTVSDGETVVDEICQDYKVTAEKPNPDSSPPPTQQHITGWVIGGSLFGAGASILLIVGLCYMWKRKHHKALSGSCFLQYPRCSCLKENVADDADTTQHNGVIGLSERSATDPHGSGESAIEQDNTLESVHVHSIDPTADGQPPQSFSLDRNSSKSGIQPTASGDVVVSDGNGATDHRAMNRSLRDDPGGENDTNGEAIVVIAEMHSGWTAGDRGPEDHGNEEQPLLSKQRAADPGFDMTGKADALVYEHGFDQDQVSRCSTVPDTDVESTPNMNNCSIQD